MSPPQPARRPQTRPVRRAVIDIGTNSIKLLVADVEGKTIRPVLEQSQQTRLGRGFYETHRLQAAAIAETATAVENFANLARQQNAASTRLIATSAARDAVNPADLTGAIQRATGLPVEIVSGEQEATWVFQGVLSDATLATNPLLILDVGGGSSEFVLGHAERISFQGSFRLGTVRLLETFHFSDPPGRVLLERCRDRLRAFVREQVATSLGKALAEMASDRVRLVGTGGTTSILARITQRLTSFDREKIEGMRLSRDELRRQTESLWSLPLAERGKIVGLPANRADVILMGTVIFESVMDEFAFGELTVSTRGVRYGAVLSDD